MKQGPLFQQQCFAVIGNQSAEPHASLLVGVAHTAQFLPASLAP